MRELQSTACFSFSLAHARDRHAQCIISAQTNYWACFDCCIQGKCEHPFSCDHLKTTAPTFCSVPFNCWATLHIFTTNLDTWRHVQLGMFLWVQLLKMVTSKGALRMGVTLSSPNRPPACLICGAGQVEGWGSLGKSLVLCRLSTWSNAVC